MPFDIVLEFFDGNKGFDYGQSNCFNKQKLEQILIIFLQVIERTQEIAIQEQEIQRRERELDSGVRRPAEAEKYKMEKLAEANRYN
jgi:hypothetical protein